MWIVRLAVRRPYTFVVRAEVYPELKDALAEAERFSCGPDAPGDRAPRQGGKTVRFLECGMSDQQGNLVARAWATRMTRRWRTAL